MPSIRSQEVRTAKLASKVLSRDHIGKAPSDIEAAILIAPAATAHCFDVSRPLGGFGLKVLTTFWAAATLLNSFEPFAPLGSFDALGAFGV
jgi:hypothetical protein